ncbi:MAG: hypothetical protein GY768_19460 [Planctomycetaceae bacterium]|nr:hypothetical protein [Planctomycetaceae bacterium]
MLTDAPTLTVETPSIDNDDEESRPEAVPFLPKSENSLMPHRMVHPVSTTQDFPAVFDWRFLLLFASATTLGFMFV